MKLVNVQEIAKLFNVKDKTVYKWSESGQIPCHKLNGCLRFDLDEIERWIRSCKKEPISSYNPLIQTGTRSLRKGGSK